VCCVLAAESFDDSREFLICLCELILCSLQLSLQLNHLLS
jgi:hypothetical protein